MSVEQRNAFFLSVYVKQKHPLEEAYKLQNNIPEPKYQELFKLWLLKNGAPEGTIDMNHTKGHPWNVKMQDRTYLVIHDPRYDPDATLSLEHKRNIERDAPGWFQYAKADKLVVFVSDEDFYVVDLPYLKAWFTLHSDKCTAQLVPKKGARWHSLYYTARVSDLEIDAWISMERKKDDTS